MSDLMRWSDSVERGKNAHVRNLPGGCLQRWLRSCGFIKDQGAFGFAVNYLYHPPVLLPFCESGNKSRNFTLREQIIKVNKPNGEDHVERTLYGQLSLEMRDV